MSQPLVRIPFVRRKDVQYNDKGIYANGKARIGHGVETEKDAGELRR
jgi:hypothetical protein